MYNFIFLYYGFLAMLTQLVVFRELSVLFYGNELFLGTFLSSWLFWVGLGSLLAPRLFKKEQFAPAYFAYGFLAVALLFCPMILLIRASKSAFAFGEFIGPLETVLYSFSIMSFLCFVIGGQFSLACAVASEKIKKESALRRVYLCETLGAVIAGVVFTYVLIGSVPTFVIALGLSLGCIFVSARLLIKKMPLRNILLIVAALAILFINFRIELFINRIQWRKYQFIQQKEARNATLALLDLGSIKNVFVDGMLAASFPNPESYEPAAHWPLLATAQPSRILILGDTSLGLLKEALKHRPDRIDYVVMDSSFIKLAEHYLEKTDIAALKNPAAHIHYADPRVFLRNNKNKYDSVIINIPEVSNLKANRFYTEEFYRQLRDVLKSDGVLGLSVASSENYLSMQTRSFNAAVFNTLKSVFKIVELIPGDSLMLFAGLSRIDMQKETFLERFNSRRISNKYLVPSYIGYKLQGKRRSELKKLLEDTAEAKINRDFSPSAYYYFSGLWLNKFVSPLGYLAGAVFLTAILLGIFKKRKILFSLISRKEPVLLFFLGFVSILLETVLLLAYQIISGYVYWQMGILFASFMLGLFLGSFFAGRYRDNLQQRYHVWLMRLSLFIIGLSLAAAFFLPHLMHLSTLQNIFIFTALLVITGITVGAAFVIAGFLIKAEDVMLKAGSLYSADLWGAALGAILATNFIVPYLGILGALNFSAVMGLVGLWLSR